MKGVYFCNLEGMCYVCFCHSRTHGTRCRLIDLEFWKKKIRRIAMKTAIPPFYQGKLGFLGRVTGNIWEESISQKIAVPRLPC